MSLAALLPARGGATGDAPLSARNWRASVVGLHVTFVLVVGLAVATVLTDPEPGGSTAIALSALGALALMYALVGARAIADEHDTGAVLYLSALVLLLGIIAWSAPNSLFLLFLAYPQIWFLVESARPGILWTCLLALTSGAGLTIAAVSNGESPVFAWTSSGVSLLFSVLMGTWISKVLEQSRQRADLIAQLEATRSELAALHHAQGVMQERERLAREVHDTLAQGYTSIVMLAQTAQAQLDAKPAAARERVELIEEVARENLAEARRVVAAFAPPALDGSTLIEAIRRQADRFERETGIPVRLELAPTVALDRDGEVVLLRATQEALTNVRRHADADAVTVSLRADTGGVLLSVVDNGAGFHPALAVGTGLAGLRGRVQQARGSVAIDSAPGRGTRLCVELPSVQVAS